MAELTTLQLENLRADLGDQAQAFSAAQLQANWDRVAGAASEFKRHRATLALCYWQLLSGAVKLHDVRVGGVDQKLSQVRDGLMRLYQLLAPDLEEAQGGRTKEIVMGQIVARPRSPRRRHPDR